MQSVMKTLKIDLKNKLRCRTKIQVQYKRIPRSLRTTSHDKSPRPRSSPRSSSNHRYQDKSPRRRPAQVHDTKTKVNVPVADQVHINIPYTPPFSHDRSLMHGDNRFIRSSPNLSRHSTLHVFLHRIQIPVLLQLGINYTIRKVVFRPFIDTETTLLLTCKDCCHVHQFVVDFNYYQSKDPISFRFILLIVITECISMSKSNSTMWEVCSSFNDFLIAGTLQLVVHVMIKVVLKQNIMYYGF